jgi:hypothetical protein
MSMTSQHNKSTTYILQKDYKREVVQGNLIGSGVSIKVVMLIKICSGAFSLRGKVARG